MSADGTAVEALGMQTGKNYYHDPHYSNPIEMQVDNVGGIAHIIQSNPSGSEVAYWNFDGTSFSQPFQLMWSYPDDGVPGHNIDGRYRRNGTKGADIAVSSDGSEVTVATLHTAQNIFLHKGTFGGAIWADDLLSGLVDGSMVALFSTDTTLGDIGMNIPNNDPKPFTEVQVSYDADNNLHVIYEATYIDVFLDTTRGYWSILNWGNILYGGAGDTNAVFYDGSEHPKPQLRYWNDITSTDVLLAECAYPMAGESYEWFGFGIPDSGRTSWGKNYNDSPIANVEFLVNKDSQEGEPMMVCVWEEMQGDVAALTDLDNSFGYTYYAYMTDLMISVSNDGISWSAPYNITKTPDKDESEVSVFRDVINNKIHMVYSEDMLPGSDRNMVYVDDYEAMYLQGWAPAEGLGALGIRKPTTEQVNIVYREFDLDEITGVKSYPIAQYTFEDGPGDVTGNGYDGTLLGDAHVKDGLLVLDGDGDAVDIPRIGGEGATYSQLTYAMWVYPTVDQVPLQFSAGFNTHGWVPGAVHFKLNYGVVNVGINEIEGGDLSGTTVVEPNMWSHIALTISETEIALYLNGVVEDSRALAAPLTNLIVGDGTIGSWTNPDVQRELTGMMEDVRIYDIGLSEQEVLYLAKETVISDVAREENSSNIPETFDLSQNYPNPFNPITHISYSLAEDVKASLKVYDLQGREVFTVFNKRQQAGFYTVTYDASKLPSGVYFYRLEAGDEVFTKKMTLLK